MIIYVVTAISGNLFSALMVDENKCFYTDEVYLCSSVGASTAITGLIGSILGYCILYWDDIPSRERGLLLCYSIVILLFTLLSGLSSSQIDSNGHVGGFLMGVFLGFILCETKAKDKWSFG